MKSFDIDKIESLEGQNKSDEPSMEKLLTGDVIKGLKPTSPVEANAELEGEEWIKFPDGTTQKVIGPDHEDGGVKMNIPDDTRIISDTLKLTSRQVKKLNKEFDLNLSVKHTFAEAIEKYSKKIGLKRLNDDQEALFGQLKDSMNKKTSEGTKRVNDEFLNKKINDIEQKKQLKEKVRSQFFDTVFDMQESTKPKEKVETDKFEYGGISKSNFTALCKKHGLTEDQGRALLKREFQPEMFADGGEKGANDGGGTFRVRTESNKFSDQGRDKQHNTDKGFGEVNSQNLEETLKELYRNFPDIVSKSDVFDINIDENGNFKYNSNINFSKQSQEVEKFQREAKSRMESTADVVLNNPDKFDPESVNSAKKFKNEQIFTDGADLVTGIDKKYGNFTSGRFNLGLDVVTPQELDDLSKKGITTVNQLTSALSSGDIKLSPETEKRLKNVQDLQKGTNADFILDPISSTPSQDNPMIPPTEQVAPPVNVPDPQSSIENLIKEPSNNGSERFFAMPDQSTLPPSALQTGTKVTNTFGRIDPIRVGIESNLAEIASQRQSVAETLSDLPSPARASALSTLLASSQKAANDAITGTNKINAQNESSAELFNIGQSDRENIAESNNRLSYEARALTAQAKTEEELRNYFEYNKEVALNNWANQQRLNLLSSLYPDYKLNTRGTAIDFAPESKLTLSDSNPFAELFGK